ncbi:hypothetical protein EMN47_12260 [Prolixibacteraceae bacterium JC049]|nr:hypothetical protein [Prolixibacteraceae bacterium JC049]
MASGLSHILLTRKIQDELPDGKLKSILAYCADSFQVGSVAPDLPYASIADNAFFANESPLADSFHYHKTNQIPLLALEKLKSLKGNMNEELHYQMFAFFLGYISHVLADGIIHPFVRDKVGNYEDNQAEHRSLEMQLDVLFFAELTKKSGLKTELNYSNLHYQIKDFFQVNGICKTLEMFSELIEVVYKEYYSPEKISGWIKGLYRMFEVAEGEHPRFYRILKSNSFTYRNIEDIDRNNAILLNKPGDRSSNFLNCEQINFFSDVIPQYYKRFVLIAQKAFDYVFENGTKLNDNDIPCINLDTGRLVENNNLNEIPYFWK